MRLKLKEIPYWMLLLILILGVIYLIKLLISGRLL